MSSDGMAASVRIPGGSARRRRDALAARPLHSHHDLDGVGSMTTALLVRGGWKGHEPEKTSGRFEAFLLEEGFDVVASDTLDAYLDRDLMGRVDLIVQTWTMGEIADDQFEGLQEAVLRGAGFAGWHGGIVDS